MARKRSSEDGPRELERNVGQSKGSTTEGRSVMSTVNRPRRRSLRWSEAATLQFVETYLKYECLWNPELDSYRKKESRDAAFAKIMHEFKESTGMILSPLQIKKKIKNLRTTYCQQLHKIISRSTDPACLYESSLPWFELMDAKLSQVSNKHIHRSATNFKPQEGDLNKTRINERDEIDKPLSSVARLQYSSDVAVKTEAAVETRSLRRRVKKKKKLKPDNRLSTYSSSDMEQEHKTVEDEFDVYGKYIASQLRKMSLRQALRLTVDINNLISGARLARAEDFAHHDSG